MEEKYTSAVSATRAGIRRSLKKNIKNMIPKNMPIQWHM